MSDPWPMTDAAMSTRQGIAVAMVDQAVVELDCEKPRPTVEFGDVHPGWGGKYTDDINTLVVQAAGFLDDPGTTDVMVRFVVAHEMGHWADPRLSRNRRWAFASALIVSAPFGIAAVTSFALGVLHAIDDEAHRLPAAAALSAMALLLLGALLGVIAMGFFRHRDEFHADSVAVSLVGPDACVETLRATPGGRFPTRRHPRTARRIERIEQSRQSGN